MTNVNDCEAELALAVGITNTNHNQRKKSNIGAGANANSSADPMSFVPSDPLAELVWSPQTGLTIKFADKKPCLMWEVGPSNLGSQDQKHVSHEVAKSSTTSHGVTGPQKQREGDPLSGCSKVEQEHVESSNVKTDGNRSCENAAILEKTRAGEDREKLEVERHGSMESCKSAASLTKRKRSSLEEELIVGSKRTKKEVNECMITKDMSFMNWLSNMLKGLKKHENYDEKMEGSRGGFRNVFESLFLRDVKAITEMESKSKECEKEGVVKHVSLYERVTKEAPKGMFDMIRRLRLSRTDILRWRNSQLSVADLDGFFVRLRLAKWEEGAAGSRYYVACITGLQGLKQGIRVKVGGVECVVESQYVSNCDFLDDELIAWWQKGWKNGGIAVVKDLEWKLAKRRTLGL